ncbi:hypothetical protein H310_08576 [Aphanomyces invadans]|uniref:Cullin-5 n=1 Tax=Aphanomyces invadans TaxID=157072 RepID=A0A024TWT4_9STRA|nr:hypothetical protein H310_08576 [Aphanomyces invadans]ETV98409.1 hypothetical protein H310_08576 [Aphanomyces invadans]|eukprot:XP_008872606.1 hypothetical protein H310_08576 [Aphanomyces invadans]
MSLLASKHVEFEVVWREIEPSVEVLVSGNHDPFSYDKWQSVYRGVYNICTNPGTPQAETLFQHLRDVFVQRVSDIADVLMAEHGEAQFLAQYCSHFNMFSTGTAYVSELFSYLNRYWIQYAHSEYGQAPIQGVYPIPELALRIWRDVLYTKLKPRVIAALLHLFHRDRENGGDNFEHGDLIASTVEIFVVLGLNKQDPLKLYREDLEAHFLADAANFYSALAQDLLGSVSIAEYLVVVEKVCKQEERRCEGKMHRITVLQTRQTCCRVLVEEHAERICDDAEAFLDNHQIHDLRRLFVLFSELPTAHALAMLKNIFKKYVERTGLAIVKQFESHDTMRNPEEYIETLVAVREKFYAVVKTAFELHPLMRTALDQACRSFTNAHPSLPELLAKYTHVLMTKSKYSTDDGMEKRVESVGVVFCLLDDKDVFKTMYSTLLAKRLIQGGAVAMDLELSLIQKLRDICGCDFVSKLQKMFTDKIVSTSTNTSYKAWKEENHRERGSPVVATIDVAIDVLTAGAWPIPTPAQKDLKLPAVWFDELELFAKFYGTQSTGRRLHWVHHMSHGIVRVAVAGRRFDLHATYHQMALLLLFNECDSATMDDLMAKTSWTKLDIQHHMQPLVKVKLFALCLNETSDVHAYSFNTAFTSKRSHLTVLPKYTQLSRPKAKSAAPSREVVEDRKMTMQAAIVRIMKSRRELSFATLLSETTHMLAMQFVPTQAFLQQNLDVLVDKEYIRVAAQGTATMPDAARAHAAVYVYVA